MPRILFMLLVMALACLRVSTLFLTPFSGGYVRTIAISRVPQEYNGKQYIYINSTRVALPSTQFVSLGDTITIKTTESEQGIVVTDMKVTTTKNLLYKVRHDFIQFVLSHTPTPAGEVLIGVVIGARDILQGRESIFIKQAGITHLLVASGTNVAFVSLLGMALLRPVLGRIRAIPVVVSLVWIYALMVGLEPAIVRSAVTFTAVLCLAFSGLYLPTLAVLFWVFLFFVVVSPLTLTDVGFYLSFSSVAGILLFESYFYRLMHFVPFKLVRKSFSTSLAASLSVFPICLLVFKSFPLVTVISTLLVSWVTMPILFLVSLSYLVSFVSMQLGTLLLLFTIPLAHYFLFVARTLSFI